MSKKGEQLRQSLDSNDGFIANGHAVVKPRTYKREKPDWTKSQSKIQKLLLRSFPKLATNPRQRSSAARWAMVINLFFTMGYTESQVAEELGSSTVKIHNVIRAIYRVANGRSANGSGALGRKRGRPPIRAIK